MARGQILKQDITKKILETFEGSFLYNDGKEIRIPGTEEGEELQIKVALTCAKENVNQGDDNKLPGETKIESTVQTKIEQTETHTEPTEAEKQNVSDLLKALGL